MIEEEVPVLSPISNNTTTVQNKESGMMFYKKKLKVTPYPTPSRTARQHRGVSGLDEVLK
jgi:hypothetical protein